MRALVVPAAGEPPTLADIPVPEVAPASVLVRVHAAGLNPVDNAIVKGMMAGMFAHEYPLVVGRDAAGVVEAVGEGVTGLAVGDEVLGHVTLTPPVHHGTLAEFAVMPANAVVLKPAALDFVTAAALPLSSAAAVGCLDAVDLQAGQTLLIVGATGGVGSYAIQLAKERGATVIATGAPADVADLRALGADEVVDYTAGSVPDAVLASHPNGVDALLELVSYTPDGLLASAAALRRGGRVASLLGAVDDEALSARGLAGTNVVATPVADVIGPVVERAAAGTLKVSVAQTLTLEEATAGLATIASGQARGKIVVRVL